MFLSLSMGIELRRCVSLDVGFCVGWSSSQRLFVRPEVTLPLNVTPIKCHSVFIRNRSCFRILLDRLEMISNEVKEGIVKVWESLE